MSASAIVTQTRTAAAGSGGTVFTINATVNNQGPLPDNGFFLYQINSQNNPSADSFARVCVLSDLTSVASGLTGYPNNRWTAVANGSSFYRTSSMNVEFNDLTSAQAGEQTLMDNINSLVNNYEGFISSFYTAGTATYYPTTNQTLLGSYVSSWQTAHNNTLTAQATAQTAANTLAQSQASLTASQNLVTILTNVQTSVVNPQQAALTAFSNQLSAATTIINSSNSRLGIPPNGFLNTLGSRAGSDFFSQLTTFLAAVYNNINYIPGAAASAFNTFWPNGGATTIVQIEDILDATLATPPSIPSTMTFTTILTNAQAGLQTATNAFNAAAANASTANQALIAAQNAESSALSQVIAVCPDFNTTTGMAN